MEPIIITYNEGKGYEVRHGDRWADHLCYDEMMGVVSAITMPEERYCLQWLRTREQHDNWNKRFNKIHNNNESKRDFIWRDFG